MFVRRRGAAAINDKLRRGFLRTGTRVFRIANICADSGYIDIFSSSIWHSLRSDVRLPSLSS